MPDSVQFSKEDLIREVRKLAAEQPNHVDFIALGDQYNAEGYTVDACNYAPYLRSDNGKQEAGCIMGQAFTRLGMDEDELTALDAGSPAISDLLADWGMNDESPEVFWLSEVQGKQDNAATWAHAVAEADRVTGLRNSNETA